MFKEQIVGIVSLYGNCLHSGHIEYIQKSKAMVDKLIVIVNNDKQAILKKGWTFMHEDERVIIIKELRSVDQVFLSIDTDPTVVESIKYLASQEKIHYFLKGG